MKRTFLVFLCTVGIASAAMSQNDQSLVGVWEGTNRQGNAIKIEFSQDGYYFLTVDGNGLTTSIQDAGQVKYAVESKQPPFRIKLFGEKDHSSFGNLDADFGENGQLELTQIVEESAFSPRESDVVLKRLQ